MNPLFGRPNNMNNPMQIMQQLRNDPIGILRQRGFSVPDGMKDPNQIINHLLSSGQLSNTKLGQLQQMAGMFR